MKRKHIIITALFCVVAVALKAQTATTPAKWHFHSINQAGMLEGEAGSAYQVQSVNGFQLNNWFAGLGVGIDNYNFRTIPLFLDIRREFGKRNNKFFVYGDAGIHFAWVADDQKSIGYNQADHFSNGFYMDAGMGYKIAINHKNSLLLNLGYSYKETSAYMPSPLYFYPMIYPGQGYPVGTPSGDVYHYHMNHLSIKVGWEF